MIRRRKRRRADSGEREQYSGIEIQTKLVINKWWSTCLFTFSEIKHILHRMFTPFVLGWNQHNAGMPFWKTHSSLWNLTSSFQTYAMLFHAKLNAGTWGHQQLCAYAGHWVRLNNVCLPQMKFSYTFSQRHNIGLLNSGGHHLSPGGNMRRDPGDSLALFGERLPRRASYRSSCAALRVGQIVGQSGRWTFFIFTFTHMLPGVWMELIVK